MKNVFLLIFTMNFLFASSSFAQEATKASCRSEISKARTLVQKVKEDVVASFYKDKSNELLSFDAISYSLLETRAFSIYSVPLSSFGIDESKFPNKNLGISAHFNYNPQFNEVRLTIVDLDLEKGAVFPFVSAQCRSYLDAKDYRASTLVMDSTGVENHRLGMNSKAELQKTVDDLHQRVQTADNEYNAYLNGIKLVEILNSTAAQ